MKKTLLLIVALSLSMALAACGGGGQTLTLTATDLKFDRTTFEVNAGEPVTLTYNNTGALEHDFSIVAIPVQDVAVTQDHAHDMPNMSQEPDLHMLAGAGETSVLKFTPTTPGTYEFFCSVAGHKEAGMTGTLIVK